MPAIQLKPWSATTMTVSVTSAAKPQKSRSIRKAMLRQRTEKNEWLESPHCAGSCGAQRKSVDPEPTIRDLRS